MCLDYRRLGKQRVEARQIQTALQQGGGWANHPATKMWEGHILALMLYSDCMVREWVRRGYKNTMPMMLTDAPDSPYTLHPTVGEIVMPPWLGDEEFHAAHRSKLLEKDPKWYGQFGWTEEPGRDYIWP